MANKTSTRMAKRHKGDTDGKPKKNRFVTILKWLCVLFIVGLAAGVGVFAWYAKDAPTITAAKLQSGGSSTIYDNQGNQLTTLGVENREYVTSKQIPQGLKDAVVAIEDRRFYKERFGVDPIRIFGAAWNNLTGNSNGLQGGSTLTQQLIKLAVFSTKASDQTLRRKAQEAWLAMQVEQKYSKAQILEYYINKVYMNNSQYGMQTAAKYYFGKNLKDLNLPQTALLAGMPQSPSGYDPYLHPEAATKRRNDVLNALLRDEKITSAQAKAAQNTSVKDGLVPQKTLTNTDTTNKVIDSYLTEVIDEVKTKLDLNPYTASLKIYTNLDMNAQRRLYDIVNTDEYVNFPSDKLQTAVTMTDPETGRVLAQIGGRKTGDVRLAFNRATRNTRSNGSTMKPLMDYGPAIEYLNYSTYQQLVDAPYNYPGTNTPLYNWDRQYQGRISMRTALVGSRNIPAVKTLNTVGLSRATAFLKGLGITLPKDQRYLSSGIGASVSSEQEAAAYGAFANGGTYYKPSYVNKVVTADGNTTPIESAGTRAMKSSTAYMITDMLKGVITSPQGTAGAARIAGLIQAGKTGTTNYDEDEIAKNPALGASGMTKDAWFTGYTRNRVISVWTGYDIATEAGLSQDQAQSIPQAIYKALMSYVVSANGLPNKDWSKPANVVVKQIRKGSNPGTEVEGSSANTTRELYVQGHEPDTVETIEVIEVPESSRSSSSQEESREESSTSSEESSESSASSSAQSQSSQPPQTGGNQNQGQNQNPPNQNNNAGPPR